MPMERNTDFFSLYSRKQTKKSKFLKTLGGGGATGLQNVFSREKPRAREPVMVGVLPGYPQLRDAEE
jgi:hypothetical protein